MSESQSRRLARAFQVLESASKAFVPGISETRAFGERDQANDAERPEERSLARRTRGRDEPAQNDSWSEADDASERTPSRRARRGEGGEAARVRL